MNNIYYGVVEDRVSDPMKLGRCKVRVIGLHTEDKTVLPTADLPWATVMQPVTSAAMSGIGHSPVGPVEGTWVIVLFNDLHLQFPIIIGTIGGIPSPLQPVVVEERIPLTDSSGNTVTDDSGNPILTGETRQVEVKPEPPKQVLSKPMTMRVSPEGIKFLQKHEGLASSSRERTRLVSANAPDSTRIFSYQDTRDIWTIGWGSIFMPDGSRVTQDSVITKAEADLLFTNRLRDEFEPGVRRMITGPVTQSMYDSLVSMAYNMGVTGLRRTPIVSLINSGDYRGAAAIIPQTKNNQGTLLNRRNDEQRLFVKNGFPSLDGELDPAPKPPEEETPPDRTQNPVVIQRDDGNGSVIRQRVFQRQSNGFQDPNRVYPKWVNEPDTHRLARGESIDRTIVFTKESARTIGVQTSAGTVWNQPPIPYNAKYPFNHVFSTESGHVQEWDDTPQNERTHSWHKSGTYTEIDVNGTTVNRIVGDKYEILERNGFIVIRGTANVTIEGNHNIRVENNANIQVLGNTNLGVTGNLHAGIGGNFLVKCGGNFSVDASRIDLNSGASGGVTVPSEAADGINEFGPLRTPSRFQELDANYESPDEGDGTQFRQRQLDAGKVDPVDVEEPGVRKEEAAAPTRRPEAIISECGFSEADLVPTLRLSRHYTLGELTRVGRSGVPRGTNVGLSAPEIVCNMKQLAVNCLDPIRERFPNMRLNSVWRSEAVNSEVGGSRNSDHLRGFAADIHLSGFDREAHFRAIQEIQRMLPAFRQLILKYRGPSSTWIHLSFNRNDNRMQSLTIANGRTVSGNSFVLVG